jgi:hypothetical protein
MKRVKPILLILLLTISTSVHGQSQEQKSLAFNGIKLPLDYKCIEGASTPFKVIPFSSGRMLVGVCNTLFMLDSKNRVAWKHAVMPMIIDFAYVESTDLVYGTAEDGVFFIIQVSSGKVLESSFINGTGDYGKVKTYKQDQCLVIFDNRGIREKYNDHLAQDELIAWRGTEFLWRIDFPIGAELIVNGDKILAVTKIKDGIFVKEIEVPQGKGVSK